MVLKRVTQNSLVQDVAEQIEEAIITREFKPGDKLPSPQGLQEILGASRGTLREALRVLAQKGLIETKLGAKGGTFVKESTTDSIAEGLGLLIRQRRISLDDLAEFRKVLESGLLNLVVERIQDVELRELRELLREYQKQAKKGAAGWHSLLEVEVRLRKVLIRIAGNRMYEAVLVPIHNNIFSYGHAYLPGEKAKVNEAYRDWRKIIDALEEKDAQTAIKVMQDHITRYTQRMKQGAAESLKKFKRAPKFLRSPQSQ